MDVKPLSAEDMQSFSCIAFKDPASIDDAIALVHKRQAIIDGRHEVIDRATHRAVSVGALLKVAECAQHKPFCGMGHCSANPCTCGLSAALAEIEEKLKS